MAKYCTCVYTGLYKDLKLLQKRKEKELELEDDQSSVKDDETKGELVCVTCYLSVQPCITQYLYTQTAQFMLICIPFSGHDFRASST